jgi:TamB, inner membrane protein subunit of TAM complex
LKFTGVVNGESTITDIYHEPIFSSNNNFNSVFVNDNKVGEGSIESVWNSKKEALYLHGSFTLGIVPNILFSGYYYPKKKEENIDMDLSLQALQMKIFEPFVKEYCSDFAGFLAGNIAVKGTVNEPKISGVLNVNAKKVKVNYLNTVYNFSHEIIIQNNSFDFDNAIIYDINHNQAVVNGKVYHDNFKNFQLDFDIHTHKFMVLNTAEVDNSLYYGKAYLSGIVNISGYMDNILIDAKVKTESANTLDKGEKTGLLSNLLSKTEITKFYIPLSGSGDLSENNFITFVKKDSSIKIKNDYKVQLGGLKLNFDLEVTPDAEVQLIFDQKVGDIIKTKGNGNIKLNIDTKGEFQMYGDYVIQSGDYLFTLKNLINKKFDIEQGSTIKWTGSPYKADLRLSTLYKAHALLSPFFPDAISNTSQINLKKRYPVDLKLLLTGDLRTPDIAFNVGLPTVDNSTRQKVMSYIDTDAELNKQVFSLLILNMFVTPSQLVGANTGSTANSASATTPTAGDKSIYAANSTSSELLSNQLNNMLSNISHNFDLGVNYRPGDVLTKEEYAVALSTQLFNDKLSIDGNLGVNNNNNTASNNNNQSANNIVGDVNMDYKLTDDGKVKLKAFNKTNDITNQMLSNGLYTQGVGVFFREEFDTIDELYKRYLHRIKYGKSKDVIP